MKVPRYIFVLIFILKKKKFFFGTVVLLWAINHNYK